MAFGLPTSFAIPHTEHLINASGAGVGAVSGAIVANKLLLSLLLLELRDNGLVDELIISSLKIPM